MGGVISNASSSALRRDFSQFAKNIHNRFVSIHLCRIIRLLPSYNETSVILPCPYRLVDCGSNTKPSSRSHSFELPFTTTEQRLPSQLRDLYCFALEAKI
uniref:Uncharacterized protein n=1 Tax=Spongospora subterranea TaxID=70186 RepID=A0A0H5QPQ0_9EUKA|eukprot:CRZ03361.1 hypothetical protein [Spongospora subterranea]